ncbi:hypothetical protein HHI36_002483 [Cryptolaemus montrouzieri]|uniref:mRNA export factor GLE1 n=1 Tax=Cryptolaemus montrouzieri TaxID=559131 RepID=A0ABD2PAN8_9CUCU
MQSVHDLIPYLEDLKVSAFRKAELIKNEVHDVTIGPNASDPKSVRTRRSISPPAKKIIPKKDLFLGTQNALPIRQIVQEYEVERQEQVRSAIESHSKKFELFAAQQNDIKKQQWLLQQQLYLENMQRQKAEIMRALEEYDKNKSEDHKKFVSRYQELEEKRKITAAVLEAKKKEKELLNECLNYQSHFHAIYHEIIMNIKECGDDEIKAKLTPSWNQCKELNDLMNALISKCKSSSGCKEAYITARGVLKRITQLKNDVAEIILRKKLMKHESQIFEKQNAQLSSVKGDNVEKPVSNNISSEQTQISLVTSPLHNNVSKSNFKWYSDIIDFQEKYSESFNELADHNKLKQFRFDCKKAINLSVNAISAVSSQHLHDKYVKLSNLIRGQNVVIGDFKINASQHPRGIQYCIDLLAKKFVLQGDLMVSSNPEAAFSFATVIISLWNECPDFGKILLAYFYKECPYLVPFYIPRAVDQTDEDFYMSWGYKYVDGQIEKQDKFLKRMTGIMRLYFAILISFPVHGQKGNPHNIKVAWTWFVSVLKLKPRIDITATMLHIFLETVGFEMQITYKMQFFKLLRYFVEHYFPALKAIDMGGPVTRLECLIQTFKENRNQFKPPNGILPKSFW